MKKKLPQIKKDFMSFLSEEDAKVIDKAASKIAIVGSIAALNFLINVDEVNAKGHKNHSNHTNSVLHKDNEPRLLNLEEEAKKETLSIQSERQCGATKTFSETITIPPKSTASVHGNHYNHCNGGKS